MEYSNIDIFFSASCNMNCQYCYIQKDKEHMHNYNEKIIKSIQEKMFAKNIAENFSEEQINYIESIGLWGAEPSINSEYFEQLLNQLFEYFPNLNKIMFSTNSYLKWDKIKNFIFGAENSVIQNEKENFELEIQFSLDGPEWINENSRLKGCTQHTLDTIYNLCKYTPEDLHYKVRVTTKSTVDAFYMGKMAENVELIQEYFDFFNNLKNNANELAKNNSHIILDLLGAPTVVDPGFHTVEDGKNFAKFVKALRTNKFNNEILFNQPFKFVQISNLKSNYNYLFNPYALTCGAGKGGIAMNHEGKVFNCHRFFRNSYIEDTSHPAVEAYTTLGKKSFKEDYERFKYISKLPHNFIDSYREYFNALAIPMAKYHQINFEYFNNEEARTWLFAFVSGVFCHLGQAEETKETFFYTPSYLRFFGNGAVEELIKYGYEKGLIRRIDNDGII